MIAGDRIVNDLGRGSEAYLQMWERAEGVPKVRCPSWDGDITRKGIGNNLRIGKHYKRVLYQAGQPVDRQRAWKWCTRNRKGGKKAPRRHTTRVFTGLPAKCSRRFSTCRSPIALRVSCVALATWGNSTALSRL